MDFMLRSTTEDAMDAVLETAGVLLEQNIGGGEIILIPAYGITLDRIGPIPALVDEEGVIVRPGDSRYHANIRATIELTEEQVAALPTFTPEPSVPYRVFI